MKKILVTGGPSVTLSDVRFGLDGSWGPDGTIVFAQVELFVRSVYESSAVGRQRDRPSTSDEEAIIGTLQYMAPEQLERQPADARTDIFAFGTVLYEMLTGSKAFDGQSQASLISAIMKDEPRPMSVLVPLAPALLERSVLQCLERSDDLF